MSVNTGSTGFIFRYLVLTIDLRLYIIINNEDYSRRRTEWRIKTEQENSTLKHSTEEISTQTWSSLSRKRVRRVASIACRGIVWLPFFDCFTVLSQRLPLLNKALPHSPSQHHRGDPPPSLLLPLWLLEILLRIDWQTWIQKIMILHTKTSTKSKSTDRFFRRFDYLVVQIEYSHH